MGLQLKDKWLWDFWTVRDGDVHHLFYLQAPRALGDPELRHWKVSIGHATSLDLRTWEVLGDVVRPGPPGAWDDYTTWTGSVVATDDGWAMLYTGTSRADEGLIQRIGLATSPDLLVWTKHPANPVLTATPGRYELLDPAIWHDQAWRDPCVVRIGGVYHAYLTARIPSGATLTRGVVAHATSHDLVGWAIKEPVVGPGDFGHLEIPQVLRVGGRWHLLFSAPAWVHAPHRRAVSATYNTVAQSPEGPFVEPSEAIVFEGEEWYGGKLVQLDDAGLVCLAWRNVRPDGSFAGELSDPWPVAALADGSLTAAAPSVE